jgi:alpha,alpha-trehalase
MPMPFSTPPDSATLTTPTTLKRTRRYAAALIAALPLACAMTPTFAQSSAPEAATSAAPQQDLQNAPKPPSELFGQLYRDVELNQVFPDSKTFADMVPNEAPSKIVAQYEVWSSRNAGITDPDARKAALREFVAQHFSDQKQSDDHYVSDPNQDVVSHIDTLWDVLRRNPDSAQQPYSSLLPLPKPYVVPGGRFNEIYYWDSYFIMLGLEASGRHDLTRDELDNFAALIDRYGHIPNGNRSYYLSRSQPPFFAQMVALVARRDGDATYVRYLPELR